MAARAPGVLSPRRRPCPLLARRGPPYNVALTSDEARYSAREAPFPVRGPAVGLFADQEIRLVDGPVFVGQPYEIERETVFLSGSRRTESLWVRSTLFEAGSERQVAVMLLNLATLKDSYAPHAAERAALYG